jgi:hypothetical protein
MKHNKEKSKVMSDTNANKRGAPTVGEYTVKKARVAAPWWYKAREHRRLQKKESDLTAAPLKKGEDKEPPARSGKTTRRAARRRVAKTSKRAERRLRRELRVIQRTQQPVLKQLAVIMEQMVDSLKSWVRVNKSTKSLHPGVEFAKAKQQLLPTNGTVGTYTKPTSVETAEREAKNSEYHAHLLKKEAARKEAQILKVLDSSVAAVSSRGYTYVCAGKGVFYAPDLRGGKRKEVDNTCLVNVGATCHAGASLRDGASCGPMNHEHTRIEKESKTYSLKVVPLFNYLSLCKDDLTPKMFDDALSRFFALRPETLVLEDQICDIAGKIFGVNVLDVKDNTVVPSTVVIPKELVTSPSVKGKEKEATPLQQVTPVARAIMPSGGVISLSMQAEKSSPVVEPITKEFVCRSCGKGTPYLAHKCPYCRQKM